MKMQLLTTISHEEVQERTKKLNDLYYKKMDKAISRIRKFPGFTLGGQKDILLAQLEVQRATIIPLKVMEERKVEAFTSVILEVSDGILSGLQESNVVKALNKAHVGPSKEKILKELMKDYDAENGRWIE